MITAVDTNVLLDVFGADPTYGPSSGAALRASLQAGRLVVSDVVWAETSASFPSPDAATQALVALGVYFVPADQHASGVAGDGWRRYRKAGGPPSRMVADFLIAAHAITLADRLLTRDRGFFRTYFRELDIVDPSR